jgi:shikimate dehydrogenase
MPVLMNSDGTPLKALVIGAGGAGKAAALAVKDMGMEVFFANRSSHAAEPFAKKIGAEYVGLEKIPLLLPQADIIIYNLSMAIPQLSGISLEDKTVFEANYAHPNLANKGASKYIDGRYWLYNQAIPAFRIFTSQEPCTAAMREVMGL